VSHARPAFSVSENDAVSSVSLRRRRGRVPRQHPPGLGGAVLVWFFAALGLAYCSSAQTDPRLQVYFSAGLVLAMFVFKRMDPEQRIPRVFFLGIATFIVLRYLFWRVLYTVEFTDWLGFSCALILLLAELYGILVLLIGNFININPITRQPVPLPDPDQVPTVDVFIPSYNESSSILEVTLLAALQMRYPEGKKKVYLCDDGGTEQKCNTGTPESRAEAQRRRLELMELCESLGANYLTREKNVSAKAGNLNEAFHRTSSDLIVIFDADHMPTEEFLEKTVGLFLHDPKLFLVQTPHFFVNPDPIEKNLDTFYQMPSENEMFYQVIQRGLDFWNSSFFCGSGAVMRREHLNITGGLSGDTITEDAETALTLHALGYNSAYIATPLLSGFAPETMGAFIKQRIRWAQGMVQILLLKCPLLIRGLSFPQRLCYFNSCFFWFFPFARLVYLLAPCAFLFFGLKIFAANWQTFLAYAVPYLIAVFSISSYLYGKVRWAFVSEVYELLQSVYILPAIFSTILNPRAPQFNVTPKGETLSRDFISPLANPFYVLALINFASLLAGVYRLFHIANQYDVYPIIITLFWGTVNTVLLLAGLGALRERRQLRVTPRMPASVFASLRLGELALPCRIVDLSIGGCQMTFRDAPVRVFQKHSTGQLEVTIGDEAVPTVLNVQLRNLRTHEETGETAIGAAFAHESIDEVRAKVRLVVGNKQRWIEFQKNRESRLSVFGCFISLAYIGVKSSGALFVHLLGNTGDAITGKTRSRKTQTFET
jgi:cellulose synthase (UDP-forming)